MRFTNIIQKVITFLKEVNLELKKVNWPTRTETIRYTLIVIGVSVVLAVYLGAVDYLFGQFLNKLLL